MATIDDRVVAMSFESSKFESGVNHTLSALDKLKKALTFQNAGKGLEDIQAAGQRVDLSHIGSAIEGLKSKFSALRLIGISVLANLATKAVTAGAAFVKSLVLDPVIQGLHEYTTNLNAVQTILANTQASGAKLKDVNKALNELNRYSDKTIYNFSEMAKNIGTFTAAGVDLKTSVAAIKGIANLAALSGSNSEQASTAMYQLSQAIAAGRVNLQDWNSVVNAGMGGTVFQRALAQTAVAMGTLNSGAVKLTGNMKNVTVNGQSFRQSLQAGPGKTSWLTSKVLTTALKTFTGDLSDAQLKAIGFTQAQIKNIQLQAKTAENAATQVKTLGQVIDVAKETAGSGWATTWQIIFGNFGQAKTLFTGVSNAVNGFINASARARNNVLKDWAALGGRTALIQAIKNVFIDLGAVLKPIKQAFRNIFPATTGKALADLTKRFETFTAALKIGPTTANNLKRTFQGFFAILSIGKQIIGGIFTALKIMFGAAASGGGSILNLTGDMGDFLTSVNAALKRGGALHNFFVKLGTALAVPIKFIKNLASALIGLFTGVSPHAASGVTGAVTGIATALTPLGGLLKGAQHVWGLFMQSMQNAAPTFQKIQQAIITFFQGIGPAISTALKNTDFSGVFNVIQVGLLGGIFVVLKKFFTGGGFIKALGGGILGNISSALAGLSGSLQALQKNIQADTLKKIAISIGILAAAVLVLSTIDSKKLNAALSAMTIGFGQLLGAMFLLTSVSKSAGFLKIPFIAAGMTLLSVAIFGLAISVRTLSGLNWNQLAKGLAGVGALLAGISLAAGPLSRSSAGLITAGLGISAIAIAMKILASAVGDFGGLSWASIGKGLAAVAISLGAIGVASNLFPSGMVRIGIGLIGVATGLKLLAGAMGTFGNMNWSTIAKGIAAIAASLVVVAVAMSAMPSNMAITAAGLVLVSVGLNGMAKAIGNFGGMSIAQIAKGLGTLAGSLLILAVALDAMSGTIGGAAALGIAAVALSLLAPAITNLGKQSWGTIIKGMIALAAALALMGVAGIALAPVAPALLALGVALLAIGGGLFLAGAGIALVGTGLAAIAVAGPAAVAILVKSFTDFLASIPKVVQGFVTALLSIVTSIAAAAPKFVTALGQILTALAGAVVAAAPALVKAFNALLSAGLQAIRDNFPQIINTGLDMLIALLKGIKDHIQMVVTQVVGIITVLIGAIGNNLGKISAAGLRMLTSMMKGIANNLSDVISAAADIIATLVRGITNGFGKVLTAGAQALGKFLVGIANNISDAITKGGAVITHFVTGLGQNAADIVRAGGTAIGKFVTALGSAGKDIANAAGSAILDFVNGLDAAVKRYEPQIVQRMVQVGIDMGVGIVKGLASEAGAIIGKAESILGSIPGAVKKLLHIGSPSKVMMVIGGQIMQGITVGLANAGVDTVNTAEDVTRSIVNTMATIPSVIDGMVDMEPVITPVLDLTQVKAGAAELTNNVIPITAAASYQQASSISASTNVVPTDDQGTPLPTSVTFEQNNYSPEALSPVEIYRQTRNQLSQARAALNV